MNTLVSDLGTMISLCCPPERDEKEADKWRLQGCFEFSCFLLFSVACSCYKRYCKQNNKEFNWADNLLIYSIQNIMFRIKSLNFEGPKIFLYLCFFYSWGSGCLILENKFLIKKQMRACVISLEVNLYQANRSHYHHISILTLQSICPSIKVCVLPQLFCPPCLQSDD